MIVNEFIPPYILPYKTKKQSKQKQLTSDLIFSILLTGKCYLFTNYAYS